MELIIKSASAALIASAAGLLIKKSNPELSLMLGLGAAAVILLSSMNFAAGLRELAETVRKMTGGSTLTAPVLKCLAIAVITRLSSELCRDSSQSAAACAVEFAGSICALSVSMPLILSVLTMIGEFI